MNALAGPRSSTLLVLRLLECPKDAVAWGQFVQRYSGVIFAWCRRHRLQEMDADDVTQNVFMAILRSLRTFDRSKARFRSWLYKVVANCVRDWCASPGHRHEKGTDAARRSLELTPALPELKKRLEEEFDLELLEVAEIRAHLEVAPRSWEAYILRCKEGLSLREAGERLGMPAGHVSKYARRVQERVTREVAELEGLCVPDQGDGAEVDHEDMPTGGALAGIPPGPSKPNGGS